jgi:hypothetical protein
MRVEGGSSWWRLDHGRGRVVHSNGGGAAPMYRQRRRGALVALLRAAWNAVVLRFLRGQVGR